MRLPPSLTRLVLRGFCPLRRGLAGTHRSQLGRSHALLGVARVIAFAETDLASGVTPQICLLWMVSS